MPTEADLSAAAAAAAEQAADPRPFGFLGVTRPTWTTRWEAHLTDAVSGERIFLGNFDARESAARAYDAAALKLYGANACGELNFNASVRHQHLTSPRTLRRRALCAHLQTLKLNFLFFFLPLCRGNDEWVPDA